MDTDLLESQDRERIKTETKFLNPTNDVAFKRIFKDKSRLLDFLNSLLERPIGAKIMNIHPLNTEELPDMGDRKRSLLDIKVKDETGQTYIIEMQRSHDSHFKSCVQCYGAHTLVSTIRKAEEEPYSNVKPVIVIAINSKKLFDDPRVPCVSFHRTRYRHAKAERSLEIAKNLFDRGADIATITEATGLSEAAIKQP